MFNTVYGVVDMYRIVVYWGYYVPAGVRMYVQYMSCCNVWCRTLPRWRLYVYAVFSRPSTRKTLETVPIPKQDIPTRWVDTCEFFSIKSEVRSHTQHCISNCVFVTDSIQAWFSYCFSGVHVCVHSALKNFWVHVFTYKRPLCCVSTCVGVYMSTNMCMYAYIRT